MTTLRDRSTRFVPRTRSAIVASALTLVGILGITGIATGAIDPSPGPSAAELDAGSKDNLAAVATNTKNGSEVYSLRLKIVQTNDPVVDAQNVAIAYASCTDCTTVAISIEAVLVYSDYVTDVTPVNLAVAINDGCTSCQTVASAYQSVTQVDNRVRLTKAGKERIAELRKELRSIRHRHLSPDEIRAEAGRIANEFFQVLKTEVVPAKVKGKDDAPSPSPSGAASSATPAPDETPGSSPAATPTATPSPDTSPTASASPQSG